MSVQFDAPKTSTRRVSATPAYRSKPGQRAMRIPTRDLVESQPDSQSQRTERRGR